MKSKKVMIPFLIALIVLPIVIFGFFHHQQNCNECFTLGALTPKTIKHFILGFGPLALIIFILLYALNTISIVPPIGVMSLSAGYIFGPLQATIALTVGSFLGTSATFFISRFFAGSVSEKFSQGKAKEFQEKLGENGFKVILFIRLIPLLPWEVVNYVSGLSKIKYRDYIVATIIGIFPAIVIQAFFSDSFSNFNWKSPTVIVSIGAFLLLGAVPAIYLKWKKKKND